MGDGGSDITRFMNQRAHAEDLSGPVDQVVSQQQEIYYRWEVRDAVQICDSRPASRYLACAHGGYHPIMQLLPNGSLAVVARGGDFWVGERGRIEWMVSNDGGESWCQPRPIVTMRPDPCHWAFGQTSQGTLLVSFVQPHNYNNGVWDTGTYRRGPLFLIRSEDLGQTWSPPVTIDTSFFPGAGFNPYGKIIELGDGTLLMGLHTISPDSTGAATFTGKGQASCYILRSRDGGQTWGDPSRLTESGFVQPALLEISAGKLLVTLTERDGAQATWQTESTDQGRTWTPPRQITSAKENHSDLLRLRDGRILLTFGHRHIPCGVQGLLSYDDGSTWDHRHRVVFAAESVYENCGNPSSVQLADGMVATAYYVHQSTGPFRHPKPYWVSTGDLQGPYAAVVKVHSKDLPDSAV